ncbi:MAG: HEPN domain-containing protein [Sphingobacterium sp.]|jgi:HEPN domain-containing protein|nr:HEPN domain-containing protein [Sphingobacterium sp.]
MKISDVIEWIQIAEEDFYSAQLLSQATLRKPNEIICYHCAQAIEKYLKGYLTYNGILPQKTHNLLLLLEFCIGNDHQFENIREECGFLNKFTNEVRYPHRIEIKEEDVIYSINAVEKIKNIEPIKKLKNIVESKN